MSSVQLNFDASQVAPDQGMETVPPGWYPALIESSEMKPTKAGDGAYLACQLNILDGQYKGRKVFINLNLRNLNVTAQEIAQKQLSAICHAVGRLQIQTNEDLHNIPMMIKVRIRKDKSGEYEDSNEISIFKHISEAAQLLAGGHSPAPAAGAPMNIPPQGQQFAPQQQAPQQQFQAPQQQFQQPQQQPQQQFQQQPQQFQQQQPQQAPVQQQQYQAPQQGTAVDQQQQQWQQPQAQQPWQQGQQAQQPQQQQPQQFQAQQQQPQQFQAEQQQQQFQPQQQQQQQQQPQQQFQAQQQPGVDPSAAQGAVPPWQRQVQQ
ncbi:hypothetical protein P6F34_gp51 [Pseudomonas phage MiCath]|uniref:Multimodular transpeptidase-transglycosylase n=1 Tax=Pseudomonas phage MiCath TaxID=3003729 RepID=A0AAE9VJ58_9CAUD|nr:hypothetical protein P6F34_gp51 [Pseudomonas phage MiCath]WAX22401.1 hypothetical protein [Pseudomonas phage MiCath]